MIFSRILNLSKAGAGEEEEDEFNYGGEVMGGFLLLLAYIIGAQHINRYKIKVLHKTGFGLLLGMFVGCILYWQQGDQYQKGESFSEAKFTYIILPPILFADGWIFKKRHLRKHQSSILWYGWWGSILFLLILIFVLSFLFNYFGSGFEQIVDTSNGISMLVICAALIPTKSVTALNLVHHHKCTHHMFGFLFGEALFNDVITICIFKRVIMFIGDDFFSFANLIGLIWSYFGSILVGYIFGIIGSFIIRVARCLTPKGKHPNPIFEVMSVYIMGNIAFDVAEQIEFNGPVTLVTFALVFRHYGWYNLSLKGIIITKGFIETLSSVCEGLLFIFIGLSFPIYMVKLSEIWWNIIIIFIVVAFCKLFQLYTIRIIRFIFLCKYCRSKCKSTGTSCDRRKNDRIEKNSEMLIFWASSQFKGAVSFALILTYQNVIGGKDQKIQKENQELCKAIIYGMVLFTTIIWGSILPLLAKICIWIGHVHKTQDMEKLIEDKDKGEFLTSRQTFDSINFDEEFTVITDLEIEQEAENERNQTTAKSCHKLKKHLIEKFLQKLLIHENVRDNKEIYKFLKDDQIELGFNYKSGKIIVQQKQEDAFKPSNQPQMENTLGTKQYEPKNTQNGTRKITEIEFMNSNDYKSHLKKLESSDDDDDEIKGNSNQEFSMDTKEDKETEL